MWVIIKATRSNSVYDRVKTSPSVVHDSLESAIAESERLANLNIGEAFVVYELRAVGHAVAIKARFSNVSWPMQSYGT